MDGSKENMMSKEVKSVFENRARYDSPANIFTVKRPEVPTHVFVDEIERAMGVTTPTCWISLDISEKMGFDYPATTPLLLGRYDRILTGESLNCFKIG